MNTALATMSAVACLAFLCRTAVAMEGPEPILNPAIHASRSGVYSLSVNPSDLLGRGPADYRFTRNGVTIWARRLPFTLWEAGVSDSGSVAGYAYSHGWRGFAEEGYQAGMGDFSVVILSPDGTIVAQDTRPRAESRFMDSPPTPLAEGVVIDEQAQRAVIRIADPDINRAVEQWWSYDLGSGRRVHVLEPATQMPGRQRRLPIVAARALPSTPLTLVHWWKYDERRSGGIFTLVDRAGKPVWSLTLDGDYNVPSDEAREEEIRQSIWKGGGILAVGTNGTFDLHRVRDGLRVSYAVEKQPPDQWKVRKVGQAPYPWPCSTSKPLAFPSVSLQKLGETKLSAPGADVKQPIRELVAFDFEPGGAICALRAGAETPPCLLLLSQKGEVLKELLLPAGVLPKQVKFSNPANVGGRRFVVCVSDQEIDGASRWFLADFAAGTVKGLPDAKCPCVDAMAGFPDGRFAALTTRFLKYTMKNGLFFFDATGKPVWSKEENGYSGQPDDLLSPLDIARHGTNELAVLDVIRHTIQIFDARGALVRLLELEKAWGRAPNYPTDLAPDSDGGFLVYDFDGPQPLVRLNADGTIRAESAPRLADRRPFRITGGVQRSPQGDLWTSDGDSLFRLSTNSIVDLVLGRQPTSAGLSAPGDVAVGPGDRVYVADERSKTVHVFDPSGKALGCCTPKPEDLTEINTVRHIAVSQNGHVFVALGVIPDKYLHFDAELKRVGWSETGVDSITQKWHFQPANDLCWIAGYHDVFLVRGLREVVRRVSRRADGRWLESPDQLAVAGDGSLAVLASSQSREISVSLYGPTGEALSTFAVPADCHGASLAYDRRRVYVRRKADVLLFASNGAPLGSFPVDAGWKWSGPFLAAKESELWFVSTADLTIHRYAVPAGPDLR